MSKVKQFFSVRYLRHNWQLYAMLLLPLIYFAIFKYGPIYGVSIAFKDYNIFAGIAQSPWIGFDVFKEVFSSTYFFLALRNTLLLNFLDLLISFPLPIVTAILLNELNGRRFKRFSQTIIYIPHFLSWVIISGMVYQVFAAPPRGVVNTIITSLGFDSVNFLGEPANWIFIYLFTGVWQSFGYGSIIYLAALTNVDPSLYESAYVDGAGRWQRIFYVTLPSIRNTIVVMLILQMGRVVNISFERPYLLSNALVADVSTVISTYTYEIGLQMMRFNFATAVGLFQSVVSFGLVLAVNAIAHRLDEGGIV